jgi:resuscitation-promoting factor RpfB
MRILSRKPTIPYGLITTVFCLVIMILGVVLASRAHAESTETPVAGDRLITLHDRGQDRVILSSATTLRQAFKEAGVQIDPNDMVEPSLDETLVASHYDVNVYRARPITVIDGTLKTKILSAYQTPEQIVKHADIELQDEDVTVVSANNDMVSQGAGLQVAIDRATPFTFVLYGKRITAYTQSTTVGEMLVQKDVKLAQNDMLSLPKSTPITAGMTVELWREGKQTITEDADVPFETEKIQDADRELGYKDVKTPGVVGKRTVSYEIEMRNGVEVSRKEIQSVTTKEPVKQVEVVGAKLPTPMNPTEAQTLGHQMMLNYGFGEDQWPCLYNLWMRESGWRTNASNPSGAYGIPQALPGSKMGGDWQNDAATQIQWGLGYIKGRYSTPCGAWSSFQAKGWY